MGAVNMFLPSSLASRRQTACFAQTLDIRDKTQAGFAQIVGIILSQIVTKVCVLFFGAFVSTSHQSSKEITKHEAPKSRKRSTQNSKMKHLKLENGAPKTRKRRTQMLKTKHPKIENKAPKS